MARAQGDGGAGIREEVLEAWLRAHVHPEARVVGLARLGEDPASGKVYGYGQPLRVTYEAGGERGDVVVRTMAPDPFGHDRRADRVATLVLAHDTFGTVPRHTRSLGVGAFDAEGRLQPLPDGEPFLVTTYAPGRLYATRLAALAAGDAHDPCDRTLASRLAAWLADLHARPAPPAAHTRAVRDAVGSGEGIFGLCDSYAPDDPVATPARLEALQVAATRWRWRLRGLAHRARRTHGDLHPFNILVSSPCDFSVLDCSRGGAGEPADDATCLSVNFLFFALRATGRFDGALRELWRVFWRSYLGRVEDPALLEVVAPFFAWRVLVLASPVWYPDTPAEVRDLLLRFAERLLDGEPFDPDAVERLLA